VRETVVFPVDLQSKRKALKKTQEEFGTLLGVTRSQVQKYEAGHRTLPTDKACEAAMILGGLTLRYKGVELELRVKQEPEQTRTVGASKASALEKMLATSNEMRDFVEHTQEMLRSMSAIILGSDQGCQAIRKATKEGYEAQVFLSSFLNKVASEYPEEFAAGIADAYVELAKVMGGASGANGSDRRAEHVQLV